MKKKSFALIIIALFLFSLAPALAQDASGDEDGETTKKTFVVKEKSFFEKIKDYEAVYKIFMFIEKIIKPVYTIVYGIIKIFVRYAIEPVLNIFGVEKGFSRLIGDIAVITFLAMCFKGIINFLTGDYVVGYLVKYSLYTTIAAVIIGGIIGYSITGNMSGVAIGAIAGFFVGILLEKVNELKQKTINLITIVFFGIISIYHYIIGYRAIFGGLIIKHFETLQFYGGFAGGVAIGYIIFEILGKLFASFFEKKKGKKRRNIWRFLSKQKKREENAEKEEREENEIENAQRRIVSLKSDFANFAANLLHEARMKGWHEDDEKIRDYKNLEKRVTEQLRVSLGNDIELNHKIIKAIELLAEEEIPFTEEKKK